MLKATALLTFSICLLAQNSRSQNNLLVTISKEKPVKNIVAAYEGFDKGKGNTSVAFDTSNIFKWSGNSPYEHESWGY